MIEYFVSYYDYYQPEAYVPQTDTYIEKDSSINSEVERLRHSATNSLLTRRDTIGQGPAGPAAPDGAAEEDRGPVRRAVCPPLLLGRLRVVRRPRLSDWGRQPTRRAAMSELALRRLVQQRHADLEPGV